MLEYTKAGDGERFAMLVVHDDAKREYVYGPALGLPDTKVGTFTEALYNEAKKQGWIAGGSAVLWLLQGGTLAIWKLDRLRRGVERIG